MSSMPLHRSLQPLALLLLLHLLSSFCPFRRRSMLPPLLHFDPPSMTSHDCQSLGHETFESLLIGSIIGIVIFDRDCGSGELGCGFCLISPYHDGGRKARTCQPASTILRVSRGLNPEGGALS